MSEENYKYQIRATTKFKKAAKLAAKRGKDTQKLKDVVEKLAKGGKVKTKMRDDGLLAVTISAESSQDVSAILHF